MRLTRSTLVLTLAALCVGVASVLAQAQAALPKAPTDEDCLACHGDASLTRSDGRSVAVATDRFAVSIHGQAGQACVSCHTDLAAAAEFPHAEKLAPVACGACHGEAARLYDTGIHAEARRVTAGSVAAACTDCHGTHEIRTAQDPDSPTHHLNLPATCGRCHGNPEIIRKARIAVGNVVAQFQDSIHGRALSRSGLLSAPNCGDCHGVHDIRRSTDAASRVFRTAVPAMCGTCHEGIARRFTAGVHGREVAKGNPEAPVCVKCHSAHGIQRVEAGSWKLQVLNECGSCHKESVRTYRDTFHGQVTQLGFVRVATCADCHGAHEIYPKREPRSTVSSANLVATCRKCHAGATASFAEYDPHADRHDRPRNPVLYYAGKFMETLLVGVFLFFGVHTALWSSRAVPLDRLRRKRRTEE